MVQKLGARQAAMMGGHGCQGRFDIAAGVFDWASGSSASLGQPSYQDRHNETCEQGIECHGNARIGAGDWVDLEGARRANSVGGDTHCKTPCLPICDRQDVHQRGHGDCPNDPC